ncbi:MAG: type I phosphomannose isomerase catalytic subunit [Chthoniobacteraceae bacterium]
MPLPEPIVFEPLFMERVWGGRRLESLYGKRLQQGVRIGESWEIVDREEAQSVVHTGAFRGTTLHELWTRHRTEVFGDHVKDAARFPLLFKLLDAQERLSVQVHPPAEVAAQLGGEPKTEMWYFMDTQLDSDLYAGLKRGVGRAEFDRALTEGRVADLIHRVTSRAGDAFFIPSGRIHAIGAGNVIFEVQQNSDTTYRVFDWNRLGLDGKPRQLHVQESLASINFDDPEPGLATRQGEIVVACEEFRVEQWRIEGARPAVENGTFAIFCVEHGEVTCGSMNFTAGQFFLVPAEWRDAEVRCNSVQSAVALRTTIPLIDE